MALFGPRRLMFGSDRPVCLLAADYPTVLESLSAALPALSAAERAKVFGATARRVYRWPDDEPGSRGSGSPEDGRNR